MGVSRTTGAAERRRRRRSAQRRVQLPPPLRRKEQKAKKTRPHRPELHLASGVSTADSAASAKNVGAPRSVLTSGLGASAKVGRVRFVSLCAQNERMHRTWEANRLDSELPSRAHALSRFTLPAHLCLSMLVLLGFILGFCFSRGVTRAPLSDALYSTFCTDCNGKSICQHSRERSKCKECFKNRTGGASICEHQRRRSTCKECGGGSICEHKRRRSACKVWAMSLVSASRDVLTCMYARGEERDGWRESAREQWWMNGRAGVSRYHAQKCAHTLTHVV